MAPLIATIVSSLIANNLPSVAQTVVDKGLEYVEGKLGVKLSPGPDGKLTSEQVTQIRIAAMKHEEFKMEQETKRIELEHKNTDSARDMQKTALQQDSWLAKHFVYLLATFWSVGTAVYLWHITFGVVPEANLRVVDTVTGFLLGTLIATIMNYFFGSSSGSVEKTKLMTVIRNDKREDDKEKENEAK